MKFLTIFLATTVLFLALKPGVNILLLQSKNEQGCCAEDCVKSPKAEIPQEKNQKDDCKGNACNPFQTCGSCFLLCLEIPAEDSQHLEISTKRVFSYQFNFSSQFISDVWQPPKFV